jgi:hypothetical protein
MKIEIMPTEYALHIALVRGRCRSPKTWKTYGLTILQLLRYMEAREIDWLIESL